MPPKVLMMTNLPFSGAALDRLLAAAGDDVVRVEPDDDAGIRAALETVEVAVLAGDLDARHLGAPRLLEELEHVAHRPLHPDGVGMVLAERRGPVEDAQARLEVVGVDTVCGDTVWVGAGHD